MYGNVSNLIVDDLFENPLISEKDIFKCKINLPRHQFLQRVILVKHELTKPDQSQKRIGTSLVGSSETDAKFRN